jgi:EAL domain-containing protein (putative c-di-GMP-specific phosphodiesterase class I)
MSLPGSLTPRHSRAAPSLEQTAALVERITMEADLRNALVAGDLVLRYQPIVELAGGRVLAFETLCRWRHWSKGLLGPAHFMPLAEETGLIVAIGGWVLEESCRRLALWRGRRPVDGGIDVTVNVSALELRDRGLVDRAAQALDASGLPADRLVLEVSEAAAYGGPQAPAHENLTALAELGVGFAIDDIGLPRPGNRYGRPDPDGWLWTLPLRMVKIERGVAASLGAASRDPGVTDGAPAGRAGRIIATALRLAAERGIPAVAKGVETSGQLEQVEQLGCPAAQGFLFARPMDPADAEAYLRRVGRSARA